jgi:RNA polymerase sigma-70 factor, ECF subfamily
MRSSVDAAPATAREGKSDADLISAMGAGDGGAFDELFRRYVRLVFRVAVDILRDAGEAEDVAQDVFLEIYRKAHLYDPARGTVRIWLLQYAYHRTLRRKATLGRRAAYRGESLDAADLLASGNSRRLSREECEWVIRAGLAQLPARQRATLELACFEELSLRDVATRLGASIGCTRHYYYRGLARLQEWARLMEERPRAGSGTAALNALPHRARRVVSAGDRAGGERCRDRRQSIRN